jgi:hypothetical protein
MSEDITMNAGLQNKTGLKVNQEREKEEWISCQKDNIDDDLLEMSWYSSNTR